LVGFSIKIIKKIIFKFLNLDCGAENIPGVYVNIQALIPWIQRTVMNMAGIESSTIANNAGGTASTTRGSFTARAAGDSASQTNATTPIPTTTNVVTNATAAAVSNSTLSQSTTFRLGANLTSTTTTRAANVTLRAAAVANQTTSTRRIKAVRV
jgi:hypothetical protein